MQKIRMTWLALNIATVGLELFQNMIVTFDLHGMNLILQKGRPA